MVHLADELDTPFSQYPYQWDALAVSSLTMATLAQIRGGRCASWLPSLTSKGLVGPQPTTFMSPRGIRDSTYFGRWVAQQISNDLNFCFLILIGNCICRTSQRYWVPIYVRLDYLVFFDQKQKGKWEAPFYRKWDRNLIMAIFTSYVDSYNVSTIKENKNSLLVIIMAISQIQLDFVLSSSSGIWLQKKGGVNFGITEFDFGITEFNFGITETKYNHFYLSSCFWSPHKVNSTCSLCLAFTFKNNYSILIQWLLNSSTPRR